MINITELEQTANKGDAKAQYKLGDMHRYGEQVPEDDAKAQYKLGDMHRYGEQVPEDDAKAFEWYMKAASQGHPDAEFMVGIMYKYGEGVERDYKKAKEWFNRYKDRQDKTKTNTGYNRDNVHK